MCVCEETGKLRKNSYFSDLCCTAFTMIVYFSYNASIHFKPIFRLWKNWFLRKWNTGFKWLKLIPKENHCNRSWLCLFFINRQEQVEIKLSNKFFPFFFNCDISFTYTLGSILHLSEIWRDNFWICGNVASSFFGYYKLNI